MTQIEDHERDNPVPESDAQREHAAWDGAFYSRENFHFPLNAQSGLDQVRYRLRGNEPSRGNSRAYALRKLKGHHELRAAVLSGRLSARAAMIAAGLRPATVTVKTADARAAVRKLVDIFGLDAIRAEVTHIHYSGAPRHSRSTAPPGVGDRRSAWRLAVQ